MMTTETLFVYGSLRDAPVQMRLLGVTLEGTVAQVYGYHRHTEFGEYPVALSVPENSVSVIEGMTLQVTPMQLQRLDDYEGVGYSRIKVTLADGQPAWMYIGNPEMYP